MRAQVTTPGTISSARVVRGTGAASTFVRGAIAPDESGRPGMTASSGRAGADGSPNGSATAIAAVPSLTPVAMSSGPMPAAGVAAVTASATSLARASATLVDGGQPVPVLRQATPDRVEVACLDRPGDRPDRAGTDRAVVDLHDRADLDAGATEEHLVRDIQLRAVDRADLRRDALGG